jgi:hypothetical protein
MIARVLVAVVLASCRHSPPPLTEARVIEEQDPVEELSFYFGTGPDNPQLSCGQMAAPADAVEQTATAIAAGWLDRSCEDDHIQRRLTIDGTRRAAHWKRSGDSPLRAREPEDGTEHSWYVTAAQFERRGAIEMLPDEVPDQIRVVIHGSWKTTDDGRVLQRAGWGPINTPNLEEEFRLRDGSWYRVRHLHGVD